MRGVDEYEITFERGLETRGSEIQKVVRIIDMLNAWLPKNELGAVEAMPGDSSLFSISGLSSKIISWLHGTNPDTDRIGFVLCSRNGTISYAYYDSGGVNSGNLIGAISGADWMFAGIVRVGVPDSAGGHTHHFFIFQGDDDGDNRVGQKTEIGSTTIDDIGLNRPNTDDVDDIYMEKVSGGEEVVGAVRYKISQVQEGVESPLSYPVRKRGEIRYELSFSGTNQSVNWGGRRMACQSPLSFYSASAQISLPGVQAGRSKSEQTGRFATRSTMGSWSPPIRQPLSIASVTGSSIGSR
jgi:hypothetical protein